MKTTVCAAALIGMCVLPGLVWAAGKGQDTKAFRQGQKEKKKAFVEQKKQEKKTFKESVKVKPQEEKKAAVKEQRAVRQAEKKTFMEKMHQDNIDFLKERLAKNSTLTDAQKNELVSDFNRQYQEKTSFRGAQQKANVAYFEKTANDPAMTQDQKRAAIRDFFARQKKQHAEGKEGIKPAVPAGVKPTPGQTTEIPANIQPQPAASAEASASPAPRPTSGARPSAAPEADYHAIEPSTVTQSF
jgi:hypothetical protein